MQHERQSRHDNGGNVLIRRGLIALVALVTLVFGALYVVQVWPGAPGLAVIGLAVSILILGFAGIQWRRTTSS